MNGSDALMLYADSATSFNHTIKLLILEIQPGTEPWSSERCRDSFASRLELVPRLRQRYLTVPFGLHHPVWVDDPAFDLDKHLDRVRCPAPGDMRALCHLVSDRYSGPLDHTRPLWHVTLVDGLAGDRLAAVLLIHHALADGAGFLEMLLRFWTTQPESLSYAASHPWTPDPLPSRVRLLRDAFLSGPAFLFKQTAFAVRSIRAIGRTCRQWQREGRALPPFPDGRHSLAPFANRISAQRSFAARSFALDRFSLAADRFGCTVNDVLLGCVAGALRSLAIDRDRAPPAAPMIATVPVVRASVGEGERDEHFSRILHTLLHVDIADPVERLAACKRSADVMKEFFAQTRDARPAALLDILHPSLVKRACRRNESRHGGWSPFANVIVSNVRGPREPLRLGDVRLADWFSTGQVSHGAGLNVTTWSYVDRFNVCILADAIMLPDPWVLMTHFESSIDELLLRQATPRQCA